MEKNYEIMTDAPNPMSFDDYERISTEEYQKMLDNDSLTEKDYQSFFERNPSFVPGAFEAIGLSGHDPYLGALISQPRLGTDIVRIPDFMWLAHDSLSFCPVFIEIEDPSKNMYRKDNVPNALFTQALDQITEWQSIFNHDENKQAFFEYYSIPDAIQKKAFSPQYVLIYGRRSEFLENVFLADKRFNKQSKNTIIMSFDRLKPKRDVYNFITVKFKDNKLRVLHIPPTFSYQACRAEHLHSYHGFVEKIDNIPNISEERRTFLKNRFDYWRKFGSLENQGIINTSDKE